MPGGNQPRTCTAQQKYSNGQHCHQNSENSASFKTEKTEKTAQWAAKTEKTAQASVANPHDVNLMMDLSLGNQKRMAILILSVCEKIGIDRKRLRAVLA